LYLPFLTALWWIDELVWSGFRETDVSNAIFIMSQPRSGTTFLLRTLAADDRFFFSLKHLEWRLPFIGFWKIIDALGQRGRFERINYWPNTELGRLASKLHFHELGSVEEHGIFFEERMYHHYFTFRRFPLPNVLERVSCIDTLTPSEKRKLVGTFSKVVQKVAYYRGSGRIWLTKENESVELYRLLREVFPRARFLVITREPNAFLGSYITMSHTCTVAKHDIDPTAISGWHAANLEFRRRQCEKQIAFCRELEVLGAVTYVSFDEFTADIFGTVCRIYEQLGMTMSREYSNYLSEIQRKQVARESGYRNAPCDTVGFEEFSKFIERVPLTCRVQHARARES
jgi:hypothetical protein